MKSCVVRTLSDICPHDIVGASFGRAYAYDDMDRLACRQGQPFVIKACVQVDEEAYHKGLAQFNMAWPAGRVRDTKTGELFEGQHEAIVPFELWLTVQREIESRRKGHQTARSESSAPLKGLLKCGYCGCAMIPAYSGKKVPGRGTFHYYRCNNTHKHVTEECQLKNISGAAIEEPIFNLVE